MGNEDGGVGRMRRMRKSGEGTGLERRVNRKLDRVGKIKGRLSGMT